MGERGKCWHKPGALVITALGRVGPVPVFTERRRTAEDRVVIVSHIDIFSPATSENPDRP